MLKCAKNEIFYATLHFKISYENKINNSIRMIDRIVFESKTRFKILHGLIDR